MELSVQVIGDRNLVQNLEQMPDIVRAILLVKVTALTGELEDLVERNIEEKFGQKTGKLLAAVDSEITATNTKVDGKVFIRGVPYANILEHGGVIPPHMIYPKNAKVLAFIGATSQKVFATHVFHPGATIKPGDFMKDAYREIATKAGREMKNAVVQGIRAKMRNG